jgi:hypothetical protein
MLKQTVRMVWSKEKGFDKLTDKQVERAVGWLQNTLAADPKTYLVYLPLLESYSVGSLRRARILVADHAAVRRAAGIP